MECKPSAHTLAVYSLTAEQYCRLWGDGRCPICRKPFAPTPNRKPVVDHDHETGEDRGILCGSCNYALGTRVPEWFQRAAEYLARPPAVELGISAKHRDWSD